MQESFGAEEAKSVEMASELLTLVNQKTHLEAVCTISRVYLFATAGTSITPLIRRCGVASSKIIPGVRDTHIPVPALSHAHT